MVSSVRRIHDYLIQLYLQFMPIISVTTAGAADFCLTEDKASYENHMLIDESMVHPTSEETMTWSFG